MLHNIFKEIIARLEPLYGVGEANAIARRLLEDGHGIRRQDLMLNPKMELGEQTRAVIKAQIRELERERPVQYVVGFTEFLSRKFSVNESVLIPRKETEELVMLILKESKAGERMLDIGTGSGAIALSLACSVVDSKITAWDISQTALEVARRNAESLRAAVDFRLVDILNVEYSDSRWDVIVSNPPYVLDSEREYMKRNVTHYEPHTALFVDDSDPLIFYRAIARFAATHLKPKGRLYFEINQRFAEETVELLTDFEHVRIMKDIHGANRIVSCNAK